MKTWIRWMAAVLALCLLLPGCKKEQESKRYEIWDGAQLRKAVDSAEPGDTLVLMQDLDLMGAAWQPLEDFAGKLDGNGKTISNFTLAENAGGKLGFFAQLSGEIRDLHLENVTLVTDGDTRYAGILAGINRGQIAACTVTGEITDENKNCCMGIMVGMNEGLLQGGGNLLTATAGSSNPQDRAQVSAKVSVRAERRNIGIAGRTAEENVDNQMLWQDTTGDFTALPEAQQQRRQKVVDKMYQMGTVQWTTSEEISYTANGNRKSTHSNVYLPGRTYIGIPYNGCEGSFERFLSVMQPQKDEEDRLVTVTGLEDGIKNKDGSVSGFILHMGNDCVGAVIWALAAGVPYSASEGGMEFTGPVYMVPNAYNTENFGALPAGGYETLPSDAAKYPSGLDARDTKSIIDLNGGPEAMAEYYARAYRGDYLICVRYSYDPETDTWKKTANHGRVLAYEPVILRGWDGVIDLEESYAITHEQGDGLYDNRLANGEYESYNGYNLKQTSWRTDYKYSLSLLLTEKGYNSAYLPGTGFGYIPVTLGAYTQENVAEFTCRETVPVQMPNRGCYESNYLMTHAVMTIRDEAGETVYEKTAYLPYRVFTEFTKLELALLFPDADEALTEGKSYRETIVVHTTGGQQLVLLEEQEFHIA